MTVSRRAFLRRGLVVGGGTLVAGTIGFGAWIQPYSGELTYDDASRPELLSDRSPPPRVLVVGGGIAGLAAAIELSARGFRVELLERSTQLGGKIATHRDRVLGDSWEIEHGFHAFFDHYKNMLSLLDRAGALTSMPRGGAYEVRFPDRPPEHYAPGDAPLLVRLGEVVARSPSLRLSQFMKGLDPLLAYEPKRTFERFDQTSFASFGAAIHPTIWSVLLEPFARQTLNDPAKLSLAEAIRFFQFYFFGNPYGLGHRLAPVSLGASVVDPLVALFLKLGGTVRTSTAVRSLVVERGRVVGVRLGGRDVDGAESIVAAELSTTALTARGGVLFGKKGDEVFALDARCTHAGCRVRWNEEAGEIHCPCHGGRYDREGNVLGGPPPKPLHRLPMHRVGDRIAVGDASDESDFLAADALVLAVDPPAMRAILSASDLARAPRLSSAIASLVPADPYAVARVWIDRPIDPSRPAFVTTAGFAPIDLIAFYDRLQEAPRAWSQKTAGAIVEVHAYALPLQSESLADEALFARMWSAAGRCVPEIASARVLAKTLQRKHDFACFAAGMAKTRPSTSTDLEGLALAGDHIALPVPASLMEAAAMSGRLAANAVFDRYGLRRASIPHVATRGPLWRVR